MLPFGYLEVVDLRDFRELRLLYDPGVPPLFAALASFFSDASCWELGSAMFMLFVEAERCGCAWPWPSDP